MSRLERGLYRPSGDEAAALAMACGAPAEDQERVRRLAEELESETVPARVVLSRGADAQRQRIGRIEADSRLPRGFQPSMVFGLLRTQAYIRTVFTPANDLSEVEAERAAAGQAGAEVATLLRRIAGEYRELDRQR